MGGFHFLFQQFHGAVALVDVDAAGRVAASGAGQLAPTDVPAELTTLESDLARRAIGAGAGFLKVPPSGGDVEHTTAGGDNYSIRLCRAGVENAHAFARGAALEAGDAVACRGIFRISARCHDHRACRGVSPAHCCVGEISFGAGQCDVAQRRVEQRQQSLCFRVAETAVVFDQLRAFRCDDQPGVEHADIRHSFPDHAGDGRADDRLEDLIYHGRWTNRGRRIGAHAAGVRSAITFVNAFVILRGRHGGDVLAIREDE